MLKGHIVVLLLISFFVPEGDWNKSLIRKQPNFLLSEKEIMISPSQMMLFSDFPAVDSSEV